MPALWMLTASLAFALMGACVKLASTHYAISEIVFARGLVGAALLYVVARHRALPLATATPGAHAWRGAIGLASLWLWFCAIAQLPLATAVTLNYMSPIWTAVLLFAIAWRQGRKQPAWPLVLAILVSFAGVVLVLRPAFASSQWSGGLMALGSGILAALAYLMVRRLSRMGEPEYRVVFYFSLMNVAGGLLGMLALPGPGRLWQAPDGAGLLLLLGVGLSGTLGQLALTRAYRLGRTLVVANLQYSGIVFSSLLGFLVWDDRLDAQVWLGIAVILASCMAAGYYNTRLAQPAPARQ